MTNQAGCGLLLFVAIAGVALAPGAMAQPIQNVQAPSLAATPERAPGSQHLVYRYDAPGGKGGKAVPAIDPDSPVNDIEKVRKRSGSKKKPVAKTAGVAAPAAPGKETPPPISAAPPPAPEPAGLPAAPQERKVRVIPLYAVPAENQR